MYDLDRWRQFLLPYCTYSLFFVLSSTDTGVASVFLVGSALMNLFVVVVVVCFCSFCYIRFLVLLHDFPEFLCEFHFPLCERIPISCVQMRNLILSSFPRNMRLPDPFYKNFKASAERSREFKERGIVQRSSAFGMVKCIHCFTFVLFWMQPESLPDIRVPPTILPIYSESIHRCGLFSDLDRYCRTRSDSQYPQTLTRWLSQPMNCLNCGVQRNSLLQSLTLHLGIEGIRFADSHRDMSSDNLSPSSLGNSRIVDTPSLDIFETLALYLDPEGF